MFRILVTDISNNLMAKGEFKTIEDAISWKTNCIENKVWGETSDYIASEPFSIDEEISAQQSKQESVEALNLGFEIVADIREINKAKIAAQTLDVAALLADPVVANIERALWNGSLDTAKALINGLQSFYSAEEKAPIVEKIDAHLAKWSV